MADHKRLTRQEKKEINKKRKILRSDLIKRGIKSKVEFEILAQQMNLVYGVRKLPAVLAFWKGLKAIEGFGVAAILATALAGIVGIYAYSSIAAAKKDFTISVSGNLQKIGFDLSSTADFAEPNVRLECDYIKDANCISIRDLPDSTVLDKEAEGDHSEECRYFAYTFWVRNAGETTTGYDWQLRAKDIQNNADKGVWVMIFDEGKQTIYTREVEEGKPESLFGYKDAHFIADAANEEYQYFKKEDKFGIKTTPYADNDKDVIANGSVDAISPKETHKYTIVAWIEGDDPDSNNKLLGGRMLFDFNIAAIGDTEPFSDIIYDKDDYNNENIAEVNEYLSSDNTEENTENTEDENSGENVNKENTEESEEEIEE